MTDAVAGNCWMTDDGYYGVGAPTEGITWFRIISVYTNSHFRTALINVICRCQDRIGLHDGIKLKSLKRNNH